VGAYYLLLFFRGPDLPFNLESFLLLFVLFFLLTGPGLVLPLFLLAMISTSWFRYIKKDTQRGVS
jgi:hypothetical protein